LAILASHDCVSIPVPHLIQNHRSSIPNPVKPPKTIHAPRAKLTFTPSLLVPEDEVEDVVAEPAVKLEARLVELVLEDETFKAGRAASVGVDAAMMEEVDRYDSVRRTGHVS
jgi:hypothetical protein